MAFAKLELQNLTKKLFFFMDMPTNKNCKISFTCYFSLNVPQCYEVKIKKPLTNIRLLCIGYIGRCRGQVADIFLGL